MKSLGICIGATTLSAVKIESRGEGAGSLKRVYLNAHNGNPRQAVMDALHTVGVSPGTKVAVTGRKFRHLLNLTSISEPEAVESALSKYNGGSKINAVVSAGGENFLVYVLGKDGKICSIQTGNKCASGTGDFYVQQLRRMGIPLEEAARFSRAERPYKVSGRCSVFCKSDCTHALNKGIPKERIASGLCRMMAGKIIEILKRLPKDRIMLIGGTCKNNIMMEFLRSEISNLIVPEEAPYFEALGAAYWALLHDTIPFKGPDQLFKQEGRTFSFLPPLRQADCLVDFKAYPENRALRGNECIIGLDVGSTTTKAVVMNVANHEVLASIYLRTNGDPVRASRDCYAEIEGQLKRKGCDPRIIGLGVTGSGRQIAGLHAMTPGIINEIIAHATAALYFDGEVDTILEIGGQDAKYTYIVNGVPVDYAMNDACSAGTGSFLEESARESLGVEMEQIAEIALEGTQPPNFNDQCAAFISSDVKTASHDGVLKQDIIAGLVYSIAMNYNSRVRGNRPAGKRVFMQGGVCCNRAVPISMAALMGKEIIVPPDPGLMGAFGVALELKRRMALGLVQAASFSISGLRDREIAYGEPFICDGGREGCDRKCEIARINLEGKVYPFGGACNRWYNLRTKVRIDSERLNYAASFEKIVFRKYAPIEGVPDGNAPVIGINKSFLTNTFFPLYRRFFTGLGFRVKLAELPEQEGMDYKGAPFCYPAEIAHGYFLNLLRSKPDFLFVPHIKGIQVEGGQKRSTTCPVCQGEPYYLKSAFKAHPTFRKIKHEKKYLEPVIDFSLGYENAQASFIGLSRPLGVSRSRAAMAYAEAVKIQQAVVREMKGEGKRFLEELERDPDRFGIVLLGRSYNAYVPETHMGIPHKFASRGIPVVPCDYLPIEGQKLDRNMYWSSGQIILKGASFIADHPQLFGCYISNFSCGPDSFLVGYVRNLMGRKPFLVLELDSHVADAGLETRIEALIDIIRNYRGLEKTARSADGTQDIRDPVPAHYDAKKNSFMDSEGKAYNLRDPHVHLVFPSMGRLSNAIGAAGFRSMNIRATALEPAGIEVLKIGRAHTSCKECLPLQLTTGTLLKYLNDRPRDDELVVYFMPTASGPCRFGQYSAFMNDLISREKLKNVVLFSLTAENSYVDMAKDLTRRVFPGLIIADVMQDIYAVLLANAVDTQAALDLFRTQWNRIVRGVERNLPFAEMKKILHAVSLDLRGIKVRRTLKETPIVLLTGEIFVRSDDLSRQHLVERLAESGFATRVAGLTEWIYYTDWCFHRGLGRNMNHFPTRVSVYLRSFFMRRYEREIKKIMSGSTLYPYKLEEVDAVVRHVGHLINPQLTGEAVLTVGSALHDILDHYCGVIAIGPFGCMPNRVAESVLTMEMNREGKIETGVKGRRRMSEFKDLQELPFLAIESDGNAFPLITTAKLEAFMLQARRVHGEMLKSKRH